MGFLIFIIIIGILALLIAASCIKIVPQHMQLFWNGWALIKQPGIQESILRCRLLSVLPVK